MSIAQTLILLRGLPGSGKSSFAALISDGGRYPVYCIDDFFTDPETGEYRFDFKDNFKAYELCRSNTENSMLNKTPVIIVENVFSLEWEMEPYFKLAAGHGYRIYVMTMENRHCGENIHGISAEQIEKMASKFNVKLL